MRLTRKALRAACLEAADACFPDPDRTVESGPMPFISPTFTEELSTLRRKARMQLVLHRALQSAAVFFLVLLLGGTAITSVPEARAAVLGWVGIRSHGEMVYQLSGEGSFLPEYSPNWIPEGFEQVGRHRSSESAFDFYTDERGNRLFISYSLMHEGQAISFPGQGRLLYAEYLTVNGMAAQYIHMVQDDIGWDEVLVWFDENRHIVFNITTTLEKEDILRIAESMKSDE